MGESIETILAVTGRKVVLKRAGLVLLSLSISLSFFFPLSLSRFVSLSLSLSFSVVFVAGFLRAMSAVKRNYLFSDNLAISGDLHLLHSVPWPSHRAISITLEST